MGNVEIEVGGNAAFVSFNEKLYEFLLFLHAMHLLLSTIVRNYVFDRSSFLHVYFFQERFFLVEVRRLQGLALLAERGVLPGVGAHQRPVRAVAHGAHGPAQLPAGGTPARPDAHGGAPAGVMAAPAQGHGGGKVVHALVPGRNYLS